MRKDMSKVLVERERLSGVYGKTVDPFAYRFVPNQGWSEDDDDDIRHEAMSMKKSHKFSGNYKRLNENLAPLKHFLQSRVGSKWNDVYSEIRSNISPNNAVQMHILQHLSQYVKTDKIEDRYYYKPPFFVDDNGILCKAKIVKRNRNSENPPMVDNLIYGYEVNQKKFSHVPVYAKLKDIWFRIVWEGELFDIIDRDGTWQRLCKHDWKYSQLDSILKESNPATKQFGGVASVFPKEDVKKEYTTSIRGVDGEYVPHKYSFTTKITLKPYFRSLSKKELRNLKLILSKRKETEV